MVVSVALSLSPRAAAFLFTFFFLYDLTSAEFSVLRPHWRENWLYELFLTVKASVIGSALLFGFMYFAVYKSESVEAQLLKCFALFLQVGFWMILFD